ncbi:MAG: TCP-1/cpn60 chaperonin family protein, partial [Caldilineaceae bacterium]
KLALLAARTKAVPAERSEQFDDLAALTGAALLGGARVRSATRARAEDLGRATRIELSSDGLAILVAADRRLAMRNEADAVRQRLAALPFNDSGRAPLVHRLAMLSGGIAELKIGAGSQLERDRLHATAERALKVLTLAQRGGAVPGAGAALIHALPAVRALADDPDRLPGDRNFGARLLAESLDAPLAQIARNAAVEHPAAVVARVADFGAPFTWDAHTNQVVDAHASGLLDATEVVTAVLTGAVSAALMALTTDVIVYHRNPAQSLEP